MKLTVKPVLTTTDIEYDNAIKPMLTMLKAIDLCPRDDITRDCPWNCDDLGDFCDNCPFAQANDKIKEAIKLIEGIVRE